MYVSVGRPKMRHAEHSVHPRSVCAGHGSRERSRKIIRDMTLFTFTLRVYASYVSFITVSEMHSSSKHN